MSQEMVLQLARETMQVTLMVSGPLLLVSLVIGILSVWPRSSRPFRI